MLWIIIIAMLAVPFLVTAGETVALIKTFRNKSSLQKQTRMKVFWFAVEIVFFLLGIFLEYALLDFDEVIFGADWTSQLANNELHQPLNLQYMPTVIAIGILFIISRLWLGVTDVAKTPPLQTVLAISGLYAGDIFAIFFTIHVYSTVDFACFLLFLPVNMILLTVRIIICKSGEYVPDPARRYRIEEKPFLKKCAGLMDKTKLWPVAAFILMWPVLGIILIILLLFGQAPDSIIKAFTETSDFLFSTKISPQNIEFDEHYLCTVAAGGDKKIVKPLRRGIRHGHEVTVNRQLCIANAFEQELEIHTPGFHKAVRGFYDKYGFPIARLIKKTWVADMVYFLMKPLEWIFVVVLYLTEVHPEDRIAIQYTGAGIVYEGDRVRITGNGKTIDK